MQRAAWCPLQVGYQVCRENKITKPEAGHLKKAGAPPMKHLREFKVGSQCCCAIAKFGAGMLGTWPI